MTAYFVTATGTEIGKTFITTAMIRAWRAQGVAARAVKPLASGFDPGNPGESDAAALLAAMGQAVTREAIAGICPWRFGAPLSPDMAAAREGRAVPYDDMVAFCRREIAGAGVPLLIEGVGGVMVPLDATRTVRDWIADLGIPAILVAGTYLGTISHTLTAAEALLARGVAIGRIVLNPLGEPPVPVEELAATLARFLPEVPVGGWDGIP